jgi:hypothetical protein
MSKKNKAPTPKDTGATEGKPVWDFAHGRRCPRCQSTDTEARSTQGGVQYRLCRRAVCRHTYSVVGRQI